MSASRSRDDEAALERVVAGILSSRKYAEVTPEVVRRVASEALAATRDERQAGRRARRKLHQAHGAFRGALDHRRIERALELLEGTRREPPDAWNGELERTSREILSLHASTAERLPFLGELYGGLLGDSLGAGSRVLDLGCGLNPFALPWMRLPPGVEYHAVDMDGRLAGSIGRYLALLGRAGTAAALDILSGAVAPGRWDVVLLMKMLPTLERQDRGSAARTIRSLDAARIVVSFPRASLGGRRKGMDERYGESMRRVAEECGLDLSLRLYPTEAVYVASHASRT